MTIPTCFEGGDGARIRTSVSGENIMNLALAGFRRDDNAAL